MLSRCVSTSYGKAAHRACVALVNEIQRDDPFAPVHVVVASTAAGLQIRRAFPDGAINVTTTTLAALADMITRPVFAASNRRPLTATQHWSHAQQSLAAFPASFSGLGQNHATIEAVAATTRELSTATPEQLTALAQRSKRGRELVQVEQVRRSLAASYYDEHDVMLAAGDIITTTPEVARALGRVVLFLPHDIASAARHFVTALASVAILHAIIAHDDDGSEASQHSFRSAPIWHTWLFELLGEPVPHAPVSGAQTTPTFIINAPDARGELRAVAADIIEQVTAGRALHELAVVTRLDEPYRRIAIQTLRDVGIAVAGRDARHLSESIAGQVAQRFLELRDGTLRRDAVLALLASGPIRDPETGLLVDRTQVDGVSRQAGVVGGFDQWNERLTALELRAHAYATPPGALLEGHGAVPDSIAATRAFVQQLHNDLSEPRPSWAATGTWLCEMLVRYLGSLDDCRDWPASERAAFERVLTLIAQLASNDDGHAAPFVVDTDSSASDTANKASPLSTPLTPPVSVTNTTSVASTLFEPALAESLRAVSARTGRFGAGVFVGSLDEIRGCAFETVYVVGMAEGRYPPRGTESSLLNDRDREACLPDAALHRDRAVRERREHLSAIGTAARQVFTFPRGDVREQRTYLPAPAVTERASKLHGAPLSATELNEMSAPWLRTIDSHYAAIVSTEPLTRRDAIVQALLSSPPDQPGLWQQLPDINRGRECVTQRASDAFTHYDGAVGTLDGLLPQRPLSATALESWAQCSFRYFLNHVLRLREIDRPETIETIAATDRGTLLHDIFDEFIRTSVPLIDPNAPWTATDRKRLLAIASKRCDHLVDRGLTGRPLLWSIERRKLMNQLATFCDQDEQIRATFGVVPIATELGFGAHDSKPADSAHDSNATDGLTITTQTGRTVRFRGRIDRVDRSPDGQRILVTDYKTGRLNWDAKQSDPLEAGHRLQLAVYALAAQRLEPTADVAAQYWFVNVGTAPDAWRTLPFRTVTERLHHVIETMLAGIEAGHFPAIPGDWQFDFMRGTDVHAHCRHCPYDKICSVDRGDDYVRKEHHEALDGHRALAISADEVSQLVATSAAFPSEFSGPLARPLRLADER